MSPEEYARATGHSEGYIRKMYPGDVIAVRIPFEEILLNCDRVKGEFYENERKNCQQVDF